MIITGGKIITSIYTKPDFKYLQDSSGNAILDHSNYLLYEEIPDLIAAIYKGNDLIWLTTYQIKVKSCYGSGIWLDDKVWLDDDTWKYN